MVGSKLNHVFFRIRAFFLSPALKRNHMSTSHAKLAGAMRLLLQHLPTTPIKKNVIYPKPVGAASAETISCCDQPNLPS